MTVLAEIKDYAELIGALRARAAQRKIALSSIEITQLAGLPDRYLTKVLAPPSGKKGQNFRALGHISMGPVLTVLGVKLHLVEDFEAMERLKGRIVTMGSGAKVSAGLAAMHKRKRISEIAVEMGRLGGLRGRPQQPQEYERGSRH